PDNRRPVDHTALDALLDSPAPWHPTPAQWQSGRVKQHLIQASLRLRLKYPQLFESDYVPVRVCGQQSDHVVAYLRACAGQWVLAVVPRACALSLAPYAQGRATLGRAFWGDTILTLPQAGSQPWRNVLSGEQGILGTDRHLALSDLLHDWPVGLWTNTSP
ncbi:MAG TPA: malto-oligosyltrehalose synthase, partial [Castellaniella sp.]|nr:malto-oligosyltrehalose synthase [Castellaniella sp.]